MIPMLMAGRFARTRTRTARRSKVWSGASSPANISLAPSEIAANTIFPEASVENLGKPTLARVRGTWSASPDTSLATATSYMYVHGGITFVSAKALAIGVTALPGPLTNPEWPWIWWDSVLVGTEVRTAVGFIDTGLNTRAVDSKAMRKIPPGSALVAVWEAGPALEGAPDTIVNFSFRMLFLPS